MKKLCFLILFALSIEKERKDSREREQLMITIIRPYRIIMLSRLERKKKLFDFFMTRAERKATTKLGKSNQTSLNDRTESKGKDHLIIFYDTKFSFSLSLSV